MRVVACDIENFASYQLLQFNFDRQGLSLISGSTGSGKSTLCDVIPWVLFGRTSKDGSVDEVLSWPGDKSTFGRISVQLQDKVVTITRERGKQNDLYYQLSTHRLDAIFRGKDLTDTQNIINNLLGIDLNLYLSGAYFHEFSQTAQFFITTAKIRRQITEQIVDLSLAKKLTESLSEYKKEIKKEKLTLSEKHLEMKHNIEYLKDTLKLEENRRQKWESGTLLKIASLIENRNNYESKQRKLFEKELAKFYEKKMDLENSVKDATDGLVPEEDIAKRKSTLEINRANLPVSICKECGSIGDKSKELLLIKEEYAIKNLEAMNEQKKIQCKIALQNLKNHIAQEPVSSLKAENSYDKQVNPYVKQVDSLMKEVNPHTEFVKKIKTDLESLVNQADKLNSEISEFVTEHNDIETLLQVTEDFRGLLIKNTIVRLENSTNKMLNDYFDSEIKVKFSIEHADKLDVSIWKDGNKCVYTQLSKGQRQLLKLTFGLSVMREVSNSNGIQFNCIFLDEALDGLDENLKIKSYDLLQQLSAEYSSVFVVEHSSALKSMFTKQFNVSLENGSSIIEEQ